MEKPSVFPHHTDGLRLAVGDIAEGLTGTPFRQISKMQMSAVAAARVLPARPISGRR